MDINWYSGAEAWPDKPAANTYRSRAHRALLQPKVRFGVLDADPVLSLHLHVPHDVRTALLAALDLLKLRMQVESLLDELPRGECQLLLLASSQGRPAMRGNRFEQLVLQFLKQADNVYGRCVPLLD